MFRYAQEHNLKEQLQLAAEVQLPVVLFEVKAADSLCEKIAEFKDTGAAAQATRLAVFSFCGSADDLQMHLAYDCYIIVTGRVCDSGEKGSRMYAVVSPAHAFLGCINC